MYLKINVKSILSITFVFMLLFSACSKYEHGPIVSLRTKTKRITGVWEIVKIAGQVTSMDAVVTMEFNENNQYIYNVSQNTQTHSSSGEWQWTSDKEGVEIQLDGDTDVFIILRLTNTNLWIGDDSGDQVEMEKQ